jgi:hypothetical protein
MSQLRLRLRELLRIPTDAELVQAVSLWVAADVTQLIANYAQPPTADLFLLHMKQARGDFLTVAECLESLNLVEDTPDFASVFLQYLDQMFKGVPAMH